MSEPEDAVETIAVETVAVTTPADVEAADGGRDELGKVRELVLRAHPDVVPDLVRGDSVDELIASVEPARSAYQRIAEQVREGGRVAGSQGGGEGDPARAGTSTAKAEPAATVPAATIATGETTVVVQPPVVPAGGGLNVVDPANLAPTTKIAQALAARRG